MLLVFYAILAMFLFLAISAYKAYKYAKMPIHGRLELYPVPKEKGHGHGGSYMEEQEWWTKPRETSFASELVDMLKEMLFIKKLFQNQKPFWWLSYALHLGIYFIIAWTIILTVGAITLLSGGTVAADSGVWGKLLFYVTPLVGWIGFMLASFGALTLIIRRLTDSVLRKYTTPQEYFNLLLLFVVTITGALVWSSDITMSNAREAMVNVLSFQPLNGDPLLITHIILTGFMLIYIPSSKMSHYVGKFFTFHKVLWDNDPNLPGSKVDEMIRQGANYKPQNKWSAPHIAGTGAPAEQAPTKR